MKKFIPYILALLILYYAFPYIFLAMPLLVSLGSTITFIATLFILMIVSLIFGKHHRFSFLFLILCIVLFIPYGFIAAYGLIRILFYAICYFVAALLGSLLGLMFSKKE